MNRLYKPYLLLFTITIPNILIFAVFSKIFYIINSELSKEFVDYWRILASYIAVACLLFTIYSIRSWLKKKDIHPYSGFVIFVTYTIFLLAYFIRYSMIIPSNIPDWMLLDIRPGITMLTLLMPALAHSMLIVVDWSNKKFESNILKDILFVIGIPASWYVLMNIFTIGRLNLINRLEAVIPIIFIVSAIGFFFFFIRILLYVLRKKPEIWQKYMGIIVLGGSIAGLMLNQSLGNVLGDFSHYGFYLLAAINGVLMIAPLRNNAKERLFLFIAKSITFVFSLYFFIVFLPYLPLSLVGIIVFGLGVLMLVPLILMFFHVRSLWFDYNYLRDFYSKKLLGALFLIGVLVMPFTAMGIIGKDKQHINDALEYTYQRSFEEESKIDINIGGIKRALTNIKQGKGLNRNNFTIFANNTPYLTAFYNWYVLDNLSISNERIKKLEDVFIGTSDIFVNDPIPTMENIPQDIQKDVFIKDIKTETEFDSEEGVFRSWIHLEIENTTGFQNEFVTSFELTEGNYISDYYLFVGEEKKHGLVADKRAANWVYQQIKSIRKDPGILTYYNGNNIDFKVFPFEGGEIRKTGIEVVHRNPLTLSIDDNSVYLEDPSHEEDIRNENIEIFEGITYISREIKKDLPKVTRKPKYYFVIDYSQASKDGIDDYTNRVEEYIKENNIEDSVEEIIALNFEENRIEYNQDWKTSIQDLDRKGGYNLDYTIKRILYESYRKNSEEYPVIVGVTDHIERAILSRDFDSLEFTAPEGLFYYNLGKDKGIKKYYLTSSEREYSLESAKVVHSIPVLEWKTTENRSFYLRDDNKDSIVISNDQLNVSNTEFGDSDWENGVMLSAMHMSYMLHPEKQFEKTLDIVKGSILSNVMSPLTSFIVLENEAQEKVMLEKQKQILATNKPLDIGGLREMDEPPLFVLGLMLVGMLILVNRFKEGRIQK